MSGISDVEKHTKSVFNLFVNSALSNLTELPKELQLAIVVLAAYYMKFPPTNTLFLRADRVVRNAPYGITLRAFHIALEHSSQMTSYLNGQLDEQIAHGVLQRALIESAHRVFRDENDLIS